MARARTEEAIRAGRYLAELRERHHFTQDHVHRALKVGYRTVQAWEGGESVPRWGNRVKLAKLYGVDVHSILGPPQEPLEIELIAGLERRVTELEDEVSYQARRLAALQEAVETHTSVSVKRVARQMRETAPGRRRAKGQTPAG